MIGISLEVILYTLETSQYVILLYIRFFPLLVRCGYLAGSTITDVAVRP